MEFFKYYNLDYGIDNPGLLISLERVSATNWQSGSAATAILSATHLNVSDSQWRMACFAC